MSDEAKKDRTSEATHVVAKATLVERLRDAAARADWREVDDVREELEQRTDAERDRGWNAAMTVAGTVCREVAKKHGPHYGGSIAEHCVKLIAEYRLENPRTNSATEVDSPSFVSPAGEELAARGFARVNDPRSTSATAEPCTVPPQGWWCSRGKGHEGPCAARETSDDQPWTKNHHDAQAWLAENIGRSHAMGDCVGSLATLLLRVRTEASAGTDYPIHCSMCAEPCRESDPHGPGYCWTCTYSMVKASNERLRNVLGIIRTWDMFNPAPGTPEPLADGPYFRKLIDDALAGPAQKRGDGT